MAGGRRSRAGQAQRERHARDQAANVGMARHIARWRSNERRGVDELGQRLNLSILVRTVMAARDHIDVNATLPVGARGFIEILIHSGVPGTAWDLHACKPSDGGITWGSTLTSNLGKFPSIKCERVGANGERVGKTVRWDNSHGLRIRHTLNCDLFNDMDLLRKLQYCPGASNADKVARKINTLISRRGVENLPDVLGAGLLP